MYCSFVAADNYRKKKPTDPQTYWRTYRDCCNGVTARHVDLWLPFVVGFAELCAYPVLMRSQQLQVIGAWLAIRTAGSGIGCVGPEGSWLLSWSGSRSITTDDLSSERAHMLQYYDAVRIDLWDEKFVHFFGRSFVNPFR